MKKHFRKELAMTKKDEKNFENSTKCYICVNVYVDGEIKLRDHCHIAGKHWGYAYREIVISKLN